MSEPAVPGTGVTRLLITGIPASGKTTVSQYLADHLGFTHVDMEAGSFRLRRELETDPEAFFSTLGKLGDAVISWGFSPYTDRPTFDKLAAAVSRVIWLDGDHVIALRNFLLRENYSPYREADYYGQMQMVLSTEIAGRPGFTRVDPFSQEGYRPLGDVAAEIMRAAGLLSCRG
jgi:hypothetical protein